MADEDVTGSDTAGRAHGPVAGLRARLFDARAILLAVTVAQAVLCLAGLASSLAAGLVVAIAVIAAGLPRRTPQQRAAERRRDANDAGRRAGERLLDALSLPAFLLMDDGTIAFANRAATDLFGAVVAGTHLSARIRSPDILDMVRETIATGRPATIEHSERVPSERWYAVSASALEGPFDAADRAFLLVFQDATEVHRIDRMRSDFVANASHELRTPLASLIGFIETLQGPARNDEKARDRFLAIMRDQAERMGRLVEDLMSLSRLELRAHVAPAATVELAPLVAHVCDTLSPLADELGVTLRRTLPATAVRVVGDRDELIQVFQNLVENACKYGQSGHFVDVAVRPGGAGGDVPDGMVDIAVTDYGPGIAPEHVPRLTERFYRVDVETSRLKKGTGLGLAIVKHILTRHRARLIVRSTLGEGATFTVRLRSA